MFEELKSGDKIQMDAQRRLRQYDQLSKLDTKGKNSEPFKSGRYKPGVQKVKQNYVATRLLYSGAGEVVNQRTMISRYISGRKSICKGVVEENMIRHFISIMQDLIELSFSTAKRAHGLILQEIERGDLSCLQVDKFDKICNRNT